MRIMLGEIAQAVVKQVKQIKQVIEEVLLNLMQIKQKKKNQKKVVVKLKIIYYLLGKNILL